MDSRNDHNIIGEVKGCIPVNLGSTFGAAQIKGLTNDVLQMLGEPPRGKDKTALSVKSKIYRPQRGEAFKFLGLYDSPEVRAATNTWKRNLLDSRTWRLGASTIRDLPETGDLSPAAVYVVYLTPDHPAGAAAGSENSCV